LNGRHFSQGAFIDKQLHSFRHPSDKKVFALAIEQLFMGCHRYALTKPKAGKIFYLAG